ncbi:hypothetical protein SODALDRAFT_356610 [Sodiomyces alkalinus F11]|uniref:Diaminohydroxyphosphoribosylamino-pyrimidine deaminase n=1 Tax=Sodiomyces alkalinus (strain CBS 110278 / VKM F-3762 / F11) TaxID=1314773 RepID=A0A3N2Q1G4_SODAK|nr:hypothetical protein SODALDRAFT_356610 [Sodiomyces alkalinus F11]ROT40597.1 hypothetical protein SODALDRAFT_356610 [Sodiomyces alkalinus F11]
MSTRALLSSFEEEVLDPEEETFDLFSHPIPSQNLGFIDPKAQSLDVSVSIPPGNQSTGPGTKGAAAREATLDFTIHQSPAILSSDRAGGTTGAVLWKITPLFAGWLASPLAQPFLPSPASEASTRPGPSSPPSILELGCGISALTALAAASRVRRYVLTDQPYVSKLVRMNLDENRAPPSSSSGKRRKTKGSGSAAVAAAAAAQGQAVGGGEIHFVPLDWELDQVTPALTCSPDRRSFDAVVACDCVYNEALVGPFVQTCADACRLRLREAEEGRGGEGAAEPCVCIVAQQLRAPEVFEAWLRAFHAHFRVWRVPDSMLSEGLRLGSGFVVHVGVLREV